MAYLLSVSEIYRVDSESEVKTMLEEAKNADQYRLIKYNCVSREQKQKGEIIDSWFKLTLVKEFNLEKEPESSVKVEYNL